MAGPRGFCSLSSTEIRLFVFLWRDKRKEEEKRQLGAQAVRLCVCFQADLSYSRAQLTKNSPSYIEPACGPSSRTDASWCL